jgi:hypothetical protein
MKTSINQIGAFEKHILFYDEDSDYMFGPRTSEVLVKELAVTDFDSEISILTLIPFFRNQKISFTNLLDALCSVEDNERVIGLIAADFAESVLFMFEEVVKNDARPRKAINVMRDEIINERFDENKIKQGCLAARQASNEHDFELNEGYLPFQLAAQAAGAVSVKNLRNVSGISLRAARQYYNYGFHLLANESIPQEDVKLHLSMLSELLLKRRSEKYGFRSDFSSIAREAEAFELKKQLCIIEGYIY